jgi:hypothetical protein
VKLYWSLRSVPGFGKVDRKSLGEAWSSCYRRDRSWQDIFSTFTLFVFAVAAGLVAEFFVSAVGVEPCSWRFYVAKYGSWLALFVAGMMVKDWVVLNAISGNLRDYAKRNFSDPRD